MRLPPCRPAGSWRDYPSLLAASTLSLPQRVRGAQIRRAIHPWVQCQVRCCVVWCPLNSSASTVAQVPPAGAYHCCTTRHLPARSLLRQPHSQPPTCCADHRACTNDGQIERRHHCQLPGRALGGHGEGCVPLLEGALIDRAQQPALCRRKSFKAGVCVPLASSVRRQPCSWRVPCDRAAGCESRARASSDAARCAQVVHNDLSNGEAVSCRGWHAWRILPPRAYPACCSLQRTAANHQLPATATGQLCGAWHADCCTHAPTLLTCPAA